MDNKEQLTIDRLVSAIIDEGAQAETVKQLESVLLDRPDLQAYYSRAAATHFLLSCELSSPQVTFSPLVPTAPGGTTLGDSTTSLCAPPPGWLEGHAPAQRRKFQGAPWLFSFRTAALLALGASLLLVVWYGGGRGSRAETAKGLRLHDKLNHLFCSEDSEAAETYSQLTRTVTPARLLLPASEPDDQAEPRLTSGVAWMEYETGNRERGRVFALPPGARMDVFIDSDATTQNTLSIVELDSYGSTAGLNYSVSNFGDDDQQWRAQDGWLGNFSQINKSDRTKYYLFAASHMVETEAEAAKTWAPSDFKHFIDSDGLAIIGWDDNTYSTIASSEMLPEKYHDYDYDDIRAIIRFSSYGESRSAKRTLEYVPMPSQAGQLAESVDAGCRLHVAADQEAYLIVSGWAKLQNAFQIVEEPSGKVVWRHDGYSLDWPLQPINRGVYVIRNHSDNDHTYKLQASCFNKTGDKKWHYTLHKQMVESRERVVVGFEDSPELGEDEDWNDVRVVVYRFGGDR
ncbi:MAG: hypothetical protein KDA37_00010 [Planctomycetales bacterium]|nr:hypothetical protein [Planctomycetales bacterium]